MTEFLSLEDLLALVGDLQVGPIRDLGLLEAAAHRPTTQLWGDEAYPSIHLKAAALLESLVRNHPLVDGNKRLGWLATFVFYSINGFASRRRTTTRTLLSSQLGVGVAEHGNDRREPCVGGVIDAVEGEPLAYFLDRAVSRGGRQRRPPQPKP